MKKVQDSGNGPSKVPPTQESPAVDPTAIERLRTLGGVKLVGRMITLFVTHVEARLVEARAAWSADRLEDLSRAAHSIKSSAGNLGAHELFSVADRIEQLAMAGDPTAGPWVPALEGAFERARARLDEYRRELQP